MPYISCTTPVRDLHPSIFVINTLIRSKFIIKNITTCTKVFWNYDLVVRPGHMFGVVWGKYGNFNSASATRVIRFWTVWTCPGQATLLTNEWSCPNSTFSHVQSRAVSSSTKILHHNSKDRRRKVFEFQMPSKEKKFLITFHLMHDAQD